MVVAHVAVGSSPISRPIFDPIESRVLDAAFSFCIRPAGMLHFSRFQKRLLIKRNVLRAAVTPKPCAASIYPMASKGTRTSAAVRGEPLPT